MKKELLLYVGLKEVKGRVEIVGTFYQIFGDECMKAAMQHLARKGAHQVLPVPLTLTKVE